jgi:hypothetical protein
MQIEQMPDICPKCLYNFCSDNFFLTTFFQTTFYPTTFFSCNLDKVVFEARYFEEKKSKQKIRPFEENVSNHEMRLRRFSLKGFYGP